MIELEVSLAGVRKLIMYESDTSLQEFIQLLKRHFALEVPNQNIILLDETRDAEITSELSLNPTRPIKIVLDSNFSPTSPATSSVNSEPSRDPRQINCSELQDIIFDESSFLTDLNKWALQHKFKVRLGEGIKVLKEKYKRTFICSIPSCTYKIVFTSSKPSSGFVVNTKLTDRYSKHSKHVSLTSLKF